MLEAIRLVDSGDLSVLAEGRLLPLPVRLPRDVWEAVKRLAIEEDRPVATMAVRLIKLGLASDDK